jgi:lipoate-protein ligase A
MLLVDQTLPTAAENIALDEALLEEAEAAPRPAELLRLWEPASPLVVIGRSSQAKAEVHLDACAGLGLPVIRRSSGGAAIVTGPGCLMYAVVLSLELRPALRAIDAAHRLVLSQIAESLRPLVAGVEICGTSDLAIRPRHLLQTGADSPHALQKFAGNSLRVKRRHLLYHGTLLYDFDLALVERCLAHPPREPSYRGGRTHSQFIANLPIPRDQLRQAVINAWQADQPHDDWPRQRTARLVAAKYSRAWWNLEGHP